MKKSKSQNPTTGQPPNSKPQSGQTVAQRHQGTLKFGVLLGFGVWCLVFLWYASSTRAQSYSIDWFSIDGGAGTSSGGAYTLSGSIGQVDAGTLSGGSYTLEGGFWPGIIVPSTGEMPTLLIQQSGANVIISWSPSPSGFSLEQSSTLLPLSWGASPGGGANPATIPLGSGPTFYRLRKP